MVDLLVSEDGRFEALSLYGGCYEGDVGFYARAKPDKLYKFDYVPVEVRSRYDPYTVWAEHGYQIAKDNSVLTFSSYILLLSGLLFAILTCVSYNAVKSSEGEEGHQLRKK